ncbi:MAG: dTDP-4-dehydrorhamnose 3,5-epimerase family protein [Deltaproteobacteria bacterium]|nr:dTDP-4-dehydrorhamnose 3,5-epimerase family protein [Deltaproteobacteria bacterium]
MKLPYGVELIPLISHKDLRGFFREIFKKSWLNIFGSEVKQVSHTFMKKNVIKAWHYHRLQTDWWYVVSGQINAFLMDFRQQEFSKPMKITLTSNKPHLLKIPPMIIHGLRVLSEECHLIYFTDQEYNPLDEGRIPYNDPRIPFKWHGPIIVGEGDLKINLI